MGGKEDLTDFVLTQIPMLTSWDVLGVNGVHEVKKSAIGGQEKFGGERADELLQS